MIAKIIPERLREAREARGYTVASFAEALDITRQAVAQFEVGITTPSAENMSKVFQLLRQPPAFFTTPRQTSREAAGTVFWRSLKRMEEADRLKIGRRLDWGLDITSYLEDYIDLPKVKLPVWHRPNENNLPWQESVEQAAAKVRETWGLGFGPIGDLIGLLEANGIICIREPVNTEDMDAVSQWQRGRPIILFSADKTSASRTRFNAAHELGHLILHADAVVDSKNLPRLEAEANYFAGAFLLPRETFSKEITSSSIESFVDLKRRWKVAISAMVYRCKNLEILDDHQVQYIWRQMNIRRIKKVEPLDNEIPVEEPKLLKAAMNMLLNNGVQSRQSISDKLLINADDIESLCGLKPGTLNNNIIQLNLKTRQNSPRT